MSTNTFIKENEICQLEKEFVSQVLGMAYGLVSYAVGAGALFWLFFAAAGFAPYGLSAFRAAGTKARS